VLFNTEEKAANKNFHQFKEYGSQRILTKKNWENEGLSTSLKKMSGKRSPHQRHESGRPKQAHTAVNMTRVDKLVLTQADQPQTHRSTIMSINTPDIHRNASNTD